jgi:hypothetical protein
MGKGETMSQMRTPPTISTEENADVPDSQKLVRIA